LRSNTALRFLSTTHHACCAEVFRKVNGELMFSRFNHSRTTDRHRLINLPLASKPRWPCPPCLLQLHGSVLLGGQSADRLHHPVRGSVRNGLLLSTLNRRHAQGYELQRCVMLARPS